MCKISKALGDRLKDTERLACEYEMILDAIESAAGGNEPSDFELSYPVVRRIWDLYLAAYLP